MVHPPVIVLGYSEAAMLLRGPGGAGVGAVISVAGAHEHVLDAPAVPRLVLHFDDVDAPDPSDPVALLRSHARLRWAAENGLRQTPPTVEDARAVIAFAEAIRDVSGTVLCQCAGGVSRSAAAALLCLAAWAGAGSEPYCVESLLKARPCAMPHGGLVRFGDDLLGRAGRLVKAVADARCDT